VTSPSGGPESSGGSPLGEDRRATVAGAVLVVAAVVIGLILLAKGFSDDGGFLSTSKKSSASAHATTTLPSAHATTTTEAVDPANVKVFVANGSGKSGAAGKVSAVLATKQYPAPAVGNAPTTATTMVYYLPGNASQAQLVASSLDLPASSVAPMPSPAPVSNLGAATVLVVIGSDGALNAVENGNPTTTASTVAKSTTTTKKS
jgi:hypothetical protein